MDRDNKNDPDSDINKIEMFIFASCTHVIYLCPYTGIFTDKK